MRDYDAVLDNAGGEVTQRSFQVLKPGGVIVSLVGQPDGQLAEKHQVTAILQWSQANTQRLNRLSALVESGKLKPQLDKVFPLDEVSAAFQHAEAGHPRGKVVIKVS